MVGPNTGHLRYVRVGEAEQGGEPLFETVHEGYVVVYVVIRNHSVPDLLSVTPDGNRDGDPYGY